MATNGAGLTEHWRNEPPPVPPDDLPALTVKIDSGEQEFSEPYVDPKTGALHAELPDGSLLIDFRGARGGGKDKTGADRHDVNLAEYIDDAELSRIGDETLDGINADIQSRQDWLDRRAAGIKHLALKIENPRSPSADADTAVDGQSTVRSPIMLDAVMRFQANARGELLPSAGPVKMRNDTNMTIPADVRQQMMATTGMIPPDSSDNRAEALEKDFNHYLTVTDRAYYPDTNRMFFMQGFGGCGFKKVYRCPIQRRPVSRACDAADIIVSDSEVSLQECGRVTHRIPMRQSVLKRMQLSGTYLDVEMVTPLPPASDALERAEEDVSGFSPNNQRPADYKHTIYECYTELDIAGFEHKEKGKRTGLPLPYRVTIDKDSQKILEIRRNWRQDDDRYLGRMPIVKYPFVEGLGFYGIGLLNIMGNATAAVTTAWRLALDSAAFASWPGFLYSDTVGRQDTMAFRVGLGAGVRVNTGGNPIGQHVMALPYKDATPGLVQVTQHIEEEARRVGGTPELMTGEGRADTPVGTTLAMIDQAVKVMDSVHKGMHIAQAEELGLLRDLFIEDPESLMCSNPSPARKWEKDDLIAALKDCNLTPQSDPNTPSHTIRVMKAVALLQMAQMDPTAWKMPDVYRRVSEMAGLGSIEELLAPPNQNAAPPDPKVIAKMMELQIKTNKLAQDAKDSQQKTALTQLDNEMTLYIETMRQKGNEAERLSRERIEGMKLHEAQRGRVFDGISRMTETGIKVAGQVEARKAAAAKTNSTNQKKK